MRSGIWVIGFLGASVISNGRLPAQEAPRKDAAPKIENRGASATGNLADRWRYKFHNGRWWYYDRSNAWSYWAGNAWTRYRPPASGRQVNGQARVDDYDNRYGDIGRPPGTVQREKNDARSPFSGPFNRRAPGTIQRQKNDARAPIMESLESRPPGTIQREKNSPRG